MSSGRNKEWPAIHLYGIYQFSNPMTKRILSGTALVMISIISVIVKNMCLLVATGLILVGLWEFFLMIEKKQVKLFKLFGLILGGLIPVSIFFQFDVTREWQ